jgi:hypothetical protein
MKKLLALGLSAIMLLGTAAAAAAVEVTVKSDLRYEFISDSSKEGEDDFYDNPDLRLQLDARFNENLLAYVRLRYQPDEDTLTRSSIKSIIVDNDLTKTVTTKIWTLAEHDFFVDEYYLTWNTCFATLKIGDFEYKVNPSQILAESNEYNIFTKADALIAGNIPLGNFYAGFAYAVSGREISKKTMKRIDVTLDGQTIQGHDDVTYSSVNSIKDGAYDICLGYKTDKYGLEFHTFDTKTDDADSVATSLSYDAWLKLCENVKVFSYGNQATYGDDSDADLNPLVGVLFANFFSPKLQASLEYALNENSNGYTPYGVQLIYNFSNRLGLELEHENTTEDDDKTVCRFRLTF